MLQACAGLPPQFRPRKSMAGIIASPERKRSPEHRRGSHGGSPAHAAPSSPGTTADVTLLRSPRMLWALLDAKVKFYILAVFRPVFGFNVLVFGATVGSKTSLLSSAGRLKHRSCTFYCFARPNSVLKRSGPSFASCSAVSIFFTTVVAKNCGFSRQGRLKPCTCVCYTAGNPSGSEPPAHQPVTVTCVELEVLTALATGPLASH